MHRRVLIPLAVAIALLAAIPPARSAVFSKTYLFKPEVTLETAADVGDGLRLDAVKFHLPSSLRGGFFRTGNAVRAEVTLSNSGTESRRFGIAIALLDESGSLLGVASGGSKWLALKPDRQSTYTLVFDNVNGEAFRAQSFKIAVEPKP